MNVHLDAEDASDLKFDQLERCRALLGEDTDVRVIAGDFNASIDVTGFESCVDPSVPTVPDYESCVQVDRPHPDRQRLPFHCTRRGPWVPGRQRKKKKNRHSRSR